LGACAAALLITLLAACGSSGSGAAESDRSEISADRAPKTAGFATSAHGGSVAFASPVSRDQGIDESWVGWYRAGDPGITVLPDLPVDAPFVNPAIQVTARSVLLIATTCPEPDSDDDEEATCGPGEPFALSYDLASEQWTRFTPPPLPEGERLGIGMVDGAPTFGVLAPTGPGSSAELVAYTQGEDASTWARLPAPPLADVADACVTGAGLVAVETAQFEGFVNAGSKTFDEMEEERRQLDTLDDGHLYAAHYDPATRTWDRSEVTANRMVGTVDCQEPGVVYGHGDTELIVKPAAGNATTFTATGEIGPSPSVVGVDGTLVATYWYGLTDPQIEQATATPGKAPTVAPLTGVAYPAVSFSLDGAGYWAGIARDHLRLYPIPTR
jgi:hypothetical protein